MHRRLFAVFVPVLIAFTAPAFGNIIIVPNFGACIGSTCVGTIASTNISNDSNKAAIEATINSAISTYEADILNSITVNINFQETSSGLGQSSFSDYAVPYSGLNGFYPALLNQAHKSADDTTALTKLTADTTSASGNDPVNGTNTVLAKAPLLRALGLRAYDASYDGTIYLNTHITSPGSAGTSGTYNLLPVVEHEIDEILGLGSTLGLNFADSTLNNDPSPEDLFRFTSAGVRTFDASSSIHAYFSLDGTTDITEFNNTGSGDYGDWAGGATHQVQDAFATPGANPVLNNELRALDVIGYDLVTAPEPATWFLFGSGLTCVAVLRKRRKLATDQPR